MFISLHSNICADQLRADADDAVEDHVCVVSEAVHLSDERAVSIELKYEEEVCSVKMKCCIVVLSYF